MPENNKMLYAGNEWFFQKFGIKPLSWKSQPCILASSFYDASSKVVPGYRKVFSSRYYSEYNKLSSIDHLLFTLKHETLDFYFLSKIFKNLPPVEIKRFETELEARLSQPLYRKLGYLYEKLTGKELPVKTDSIAKREYTELLDSTLYYTVDNRSAGETEARWKITNNSLGEPGVFCPIVMREEGTLLNKRIVAGYDDYLQNIPVSIRKLAANGLYDADSMASFNLEGEDTTLPETEARIAAYTRALKSLAAAPIRFTESELTQLQNMCVTEDKRSDGYRSFQNAIGGRGGVPSYICPPPESVRRLMEQIGKIRDELRDNADPAVTAAVVSGGFVLVHPFLDGNGRLSRLLVSDALSQSSKEAIIPVSMGIEAKREEYIAVLARQTAPIMKNTNYTIEDGFYKVIAPDADMYKYPDFTGYAAFLSQAVDDTITKHVPDEVKLITTENQIRQRFNKTVDSSQLPPDTAKIVIRSIAENGGKISKGKLKLLGRFLPKEELANLKEEFSDSEGSQKMNSAEPGCDGHEL